MQIRDIHLRDMHIREMFRDAHEIVMISDRNEAAMIASRTMDHQPRPAKHNSPECVICRPRLRLSDLPCANGIGLDDRLLIGTKSV
jgi:hypothetical protein